MDPELVELAGTAATTLITLMATDSWHLVKDRFASLWRRVHPDQAQVVAGELETTRDDLLQARDDDQALTMAELTAEWQGRIRRLLAAHPEALSELKGLLTEVAEKETTAPSVKQHATAYGHARVYQAGRDQNIG